MCRDPSPDQAKPYAVKAVPANKTTFLAKVGREMEFQSKQEFGEWREIRSNCSERQPFKPVGTESLSYSSLYLVFPAASICEGLGLCFLCYLLSLL
jgi:hypothetical protein